MMLENMANLDFSKELFASVSLTTFAASALGATLVYVALLSTYRLTFHPLAKYPGPLLAKLTTLYAVYHGYVGDMHLDIERLHQRYGTFVRYAPNALVVGSVDGFHDIYDAGKNVKKSKSYKIHGPGSLIGIQDKVKYVSSIRFSPDSAVRRYESKVLQLIDEFCTKIMPDSTSEKNGGWSEFKDMSTWCNYLTLDIVTKVVFTTTWSLLSSPINRGVISTIATVVHLLGIVHQNAWLYTNKLAILCSFPGLAKSQPALRKYTVDIITSGMEARKQDPDLDDAFAYVLKAKDPESKTGEGLSFQDTRLNCALLLVAGSDTSSSALASTFFYLSHNPGAYQQVANEVRDTFSSVSEIRAGTVLNSCFYLRAAINEAMRMSPVVAQPLWREVEGGGAVIAGQQIPAGFNVGAGIYTLHHHADIFPLPYTYDIKRWVPQEGKDIEEEKARIRACQRAFAPFSTGPRQCIAKNFAMMELLLTMATVLFKMDFEYEGKTGEGIGDRKGEFQLKSFFTSHMEGPMIRFRNRDLEDK